MLVIGRGPSVKEYPPELLNWSAKVNLSVGCNNAGLDWPVDIICSIDFQWILDHKAELQKINKPIITRDWDCIKNLGLNLIPLNNNILKTCRLSGQTAIKCLDYIGQPLNLPVHVIGIDHTDIHYDGTGTNIPDIVPMDMYEAMGCNVVNLGKASKIKCWPRHYALPGPDGVDKKTLPEIIKAIKRIPL